MEVVLITKRNIERLENIVKHYAMIDYLRANRLKNGKIRKKYRPYTLSPRTNEARGMLKISRKKEITKEEENIVKDYLLKAKLLEIEDGIN